MSSRCRSLSDFRLIRDPRPRRGRGGGPRLSRPEPPESTRKECVRFHSITTTRPLGELLVVVPEVKTYKFTPIFHL